MYSTEINITPHLPKSFLRAIFEIYEVAKQDNSHITPEKIKNLLISRAGKDTVTVILFHQNNSIFFLPAQQRKCTKLRTEICGIVKAKNLLLKSPSAYKERIFNTRSLKDKVALSYIDKLDQFPEWKLIDVTTESIQTKNLINMTESDNGESTPLGEESKVKVNTLESNQADGDGCSKRTPKLQEFNTKLNVDQWVSNCTWILSLHNIKSEKRIVAEMLSRLPLDIASQVRKIMKNSSEADDVKVKEFTDAVKIASRQTPSDLSMALKDLKFGQEGCTTMKELWISLECLLSSLYPTLASDESAKTEFEKLISAKFREKVPASVKNSINFQLSEDVGTKLVTLCTKILESARVNSNYIRDKKPKNQENDSKNEGKARGFQKNDRGSSYRKKPNETGKKTDKSKEKTGPCFFCGGKNHVKKDCRKYAMYLKGVEKSQDEKKK